MNFGVRLPGPFRVGFSDKGRVNVGVTLGPFSASTGISQGASGRQPFHPISLDGAMNELVTHGWRLRGHDRRIAHLTKGWRAVQIEAVRGGVTWRPVTSRRTILTWLFVAVAVVGLCALAGCGPNKAPATTEPAHPGAYCQQAGIRGQTDAGRPMVCATTAADDKLRWRAG